MLFAVQQSWADLTPPSSLLSIDGMPYTNVTLSISSKKTTQQLVHPRLGALEWGPRGGGGGGGGGVALEEICLGEWGWVPGKQLT